MKFIFLITEKFSPGMTVEDLENKPVGGSLTAALWMADELRQLGHEVEFQTQPDEVPDNICDVFIALRTWRTFWLGKHPGKLNYLWCQDDVDQPYLEPLGDPAVAQKTYANMTGAILISHYQARRWVETLRLPPDKIFLSRNGIPLHHFKPQNILNRPPKAYFASTPFRGLDVLLHAWPLIHQAVPEAELLLFSSLAVYGADQETEKKKMEEKIQTAPGVCVLGSVGQKHLREAAKQCRVLAYPCVFPETGCISAMEAMASGCVVASTNSGALPETAWRNPLVSMNGNWLAKWAFEVARLLVDDEYYTFHARQNLDLAEALDWKLIAREWVSRFEK